MTRGHREGATVGPLPRVIHRIWVGGPEPGWLRRLGDTWAAHHPAWEQRQWHDGNVAELFPLDNQHVYDHAEAISPNHVGQLRADVLRYEILWRHGGMYVDADFECLRPLDPLISGLDCFATFETQGRWVANGLMGATPRHPFVRRLIDGVPDAVGARARRARPAQITGPGLLTALWAAHPDEIAVLDQRHFYPYGHRDVDRHPIGERFTDPQLYAVHVWRNRRRERGLLAEVEP